MLRFLSRLIGLVLLGASVILAVIDATQTVASSQMVLTPLAESWLAASPTTLNQAQWVIQQYTFPVIWDPVMIWILSLPGFAIFLILAMIFLYLGTSRQRSTDPVAG